ncbi:MAG: phosphatase PAP2 family protein [Actinomycetota bacterium]|nr:phosphatase PAP2 family protein [Actinomycetota bacterium]
MPSQLRSLRTRFLPHGPLDLLWQFALFATAFYAYRITRGFIDDPQGAAVAFENARALIHVEQSLGVFVEPSVQAWADTKPVIIDFASWMYLNAQTSMTLAALVFLYIFHNRSFYFVRNMFLVAFAVALVGYVVLPTAPPRFFPEWGFYDTVSDFAGVNHDSVTVDSLFNPYAAVPSMHIAFSLMISVPLARLCRHRAARIAWAAYPLLILFVIVATGNHFFSDAVLGAVTAGIGALAADRMGRVRPTAWAFAQI